MLRSLASFGSGRLVTPMLVVVLAACGTAGPAVVDVDGRITDAFGVGVPNISVAPLGGVPTVTGTDGSFAFTGVETPYDLVAFSAGDAWAHVFLDLAVAEPQIVPGEAIFGDSILQTASADIAVTPDVAPVAGQLLVVCVENPSLAMASCEEIDDVDPIPATVTAGWFGPGSVDATVRGVLFQLGADGLPNDVLRMGTATVNVGDGDTPALALPTAAFASADVTVDVSVPAGVVLDGVGAILVLPDGRNAFRVPFGAPLGTTSTIALPDIAGASVVVAAAGTDANGADTIAWSAPVALATTTVDVALSTVPVMSQPGPAAVGVGTGDVFEVQERAGNAYTFVIGPDGGGSGPEVLISSVDGRIALPDLGGLDPALSMPGAQAYRWSVFLFAPVSGSAALASDGGAAAAYTALTLAAGSGYGSGPTTAGAFGVTPERTFTTP